MDKYAVIQFGGKQIMVSEGQVFEIEHQKELNPEVLLFSDGNSVELGEPSLTDVEVKMSLVKEKLSDKVVVARYKSKSRYRKKKGHRQVLSVLKVESIGKKGSKTSKTEKPEKEKTVKKSTKTKEDSKE